MTFSFCIFYNWGYPLSILLSIGLGRLWYGELFNDLWIEYNNFSPRSQKRWKEKGHGNRPMIFTLFSFIMMATIVQYIVHVTHTNTALNGCYLGALLWVGMAFPLKMVHYAKTPRKKKVVVLLDLAYQLTYFIMQSAVMAHFTKSDAN
eukprot:34862_1